MLVMELATLKIVGLGPGDADLIPTRNLEVLKEASGRVLVRTERHPAVEVLKAAGVRFEALDGLYEGATCFEEVYERVAARVLEVSLDGGGPVAYAVPGNPWVGEASVRMIRQRAPSLGVRCEVYPAMGFLEAVWDVLETDPLGEGVQVVDAFELMGRAGLPYACGTGRPLLIAQVYDRYVASEVKLWLAQAYGDCFPVKVIRGACAGSGQRVEEVPVYQLDRLTWVDHLTSVYVPARAVQRGLSLEALVAVVARLRGEGGCPWDRAQTHESIRRYLIEEAYEVVEAIEANDANKLREELGDLLLQIALHSRIAQERGEFDIYQVIGSIVEKMIRRHPHVFGRGEVRGTCKTPEDVLQRWEAIKEGEKATGDAERSLSELRKGWPALLRAEEVQKAASRAGFDWEDPEGVLAKLREEILELERACASGDDRAKEDEIGDILFSVVNLSRFLDVDAELALERSIRKFARRFERMKDLAGARGRRLEEMDVREMDELWEECKRTEAV